MCFIAMSIALALLACLLNLIEVDSAEVEKNPQPAILGPVPPGEGSNPEIQVTETGASQNPQIESWDLENYLMIQKRYCGE